ncbi:2023_t:CDS:2 [Funneliformis mosseae]|uniref:2023_t:CDS:1 n=1 Tax=Funneliformis mosseae TaxID=27381 RepID=A0A9N9GS18_FUNMO|nr:2023_t:CDS:2 [Funneliformis mosseae]
MESVYFKNPLECTVIGLLMIPIEQDLNYKNEYDLNEPHYRVNFSYAYPSEIDIKESDGNKLNEELRDIDPSNNNAIEDAYVVSQALLNNSSGNNISCI